MSSQLKKKTKKKKKKKDEDESGPQKHERVGNLNFYGEEISKNIIEKIISLAVSTNFRRKVEKKSNNFCYQFLKKQFDNIIQIMHIDHENDDFDIDNLDINRYIKTNKSDNDIKRYLLSNHKNAIESRNSKAEKKIMEIANIEKDTKTYMNIKNKKIEDCLNKSVIIKNNKHLKKPKIIQYKIDIEKKNFWGDIPSPPICDIDRTSSNFNNYKPKKEESHKNSPSRNKQEENIVNNEDEKRKKPFLTYKNFIANLSRNFSLIKGSKYEDAFIKKKRVQMIDMPSFPIENLEVKKETDEILNLRKEKMEMIIQREKELKRLEIQKMKIKKEEAENAKMKKKGKFTYDNEGNLILVNEIKQDNLFKEFWQITSKQKEIKPGKDIEIYKKERIKMENIAKKNIIYNEEDQNHYNSFLMKLRLTEPLINLNDMKKNLKESSNKSKKRFDGLFFDRFNTNKKIQPSGSNFQLMNPAVGVNIKEKSFVKSGGNDYFKEFKKYSIEEFNKTLQDNVEWTKYKQIEEKDKLLDGFKTTTSNGFQKLKRISLLKKSMEKNSNEINSILNNDTIKNNNYITRIKRNIKNKNEQNNFGKTFTNGFNTNKYKKNLMKSTSEIVLGTEKFINLKELLFHDDKEKFVKITPYNSRHKNNKILFNQYRHKSSEKRENKFSDAKKRFYDIDNLNKNLITGKASNQTILFNKIVLPKISIRNNETNFNRTMMNFNRERTKKVIEGFSLNKDKDNILNVKKIRKIKSVKFD